MGSGKSLDAEEVLCLCAYNLVQLASFIESLQNNEELLSDIGELTAEYAPFARRTERASEYCPGDWNKVTNALAEIDKALADTKKNDQEKTVAAKRGLGNARASFFDIIEGWCPHDLTQDSGGVGWLTSR